MSEAVRSDRMEFSLLARAARRMLGVVAHLICFCAGAAQAQPYPSRAITIVVALPAGGAVDALARIIAEPMRSRLGQPVIIENLGGAGGTLAVGRVVRSAPDGYTLGLGTVGQYVISGAVYTLPFDMLADLTPVAPLPSVPYWMTARRTLPASNLSELADWLRHNKASASTVGVASLARFCGMAFQRASGTDFQFVPYRGGAPALQDLVAGNVDLNCDLASNSLAQYRNGNIKVYAVMASTRWAPAPEVPTTDEAGFPGLHFSTWLGLWAPKNTPGDIVGKVNAAALAAMAEPNARKRIADLGMQVPPHERSRPAAFAAFHKAEVEKWYPIVRAAGIKAE